MIYKLNTNDAEQTMAFFEAAELDAISGAHIRTMHSMFSDDAKASADFWYQLDFAGRPSAAMSHNAGRLHISHGANADLNELEDFARSTVEGCQYLSVSAALSVMLDDLGPSRELYKMARSGGGFPEDDFALIAKPTLSSVYDLLYESDPWFKTRYDHAAWHLHTSRLVRRKLGYCVGIVRDDGRLISTGGLYASGLSHGIIGGLATLPEEQGQGYSGLICRYLANRIIRDNKTPALLAATESLAVYYGSMGFEEKGKWVELDVKR